MKKQTTDGKEKYIMGKPLGMSRYSYDINNTASDRRKYAIASNNRKEEFYERSKVLRLRVVESNKLSSSRLCRCGESCT